MLTEQQLATCTGATLGNASQWLSHICAAMARHGISDSLHIAAFLAQVGVESGGLRLLEENLNYTSAERLQAIWPNRFPTPESAQPFVRNPQALANKVYAERMGNTEPGDGYRFRGRGLKQLTGRDNYSTYAKASGVDVIANPDLLLQPEHAADSAAWFWQANDCASFADKQDWRGLTRRINGGLIGYDQRLALTEDGLRLLA